MLDENKYYMNSSTGSVDLGSNWMDDFRSRDVDEFPTWESWGGDSFVELDYSGMGFYDLSCLMPKECKDHCSESGDNYFACKMWANDLNLNQSRETCLKIMQEHALEDYENDSDEELRIKFLWLAAGMNDE